MRNKHLLKATAQDKIGFTVMKNALNLTHCCKVVQQPLLVLIGLFIAICITHAQDLSKSTYASKDFKDINPSMIARDSGDVTIYSVPNVPNIQMMVSKSSTNRLSNERQVVPNTVATTANALMSAPSCIAAPSYPADKQTGICPAFTVSWPPVSGATGYKVYLDVYNENLPPTDANLAYWYTRPGTSAGPFYTSENRTIYWKIVPVNGDGEAMGCPIWSFTLGTWNRPTVQATVSPGSSVCAGTPVTFTATPSNGNTNAQYAWYNGYINNFGFPYPNYIAGETGSTFTRSNLANGDKIGVQMGQDLNICTLSALSNEITMTVTPPVTPSVSLNSSAVNNTICAGTSVTFAATPTNGGTTPIYKWTINGTAQPETGVTLTRSNLADGSTIQAELTSNDACANPKLVSSNEITMVVIPYNTISLTSAPETDNQTVCVNTPITNIVYTTTGATNAGIAGLPPGVNGNWSNNQFTISGTPTHENPVAYMITLLGGCAPPLSPVTASGKINVLPNNTISLSSVAATTAQTICISTPIVNITYATTGATGATVSGLPMGVSGSFANNVVTISGTPTASGTFSYMVNLTGGCGTVTASGSFKVNPNNTISLTSAAATTAQIVCINTAMAKITYNTTSATGATFMGLPAGVNGSWAANVVTISGTPTVAGSFNYTVTLTGGCSIVTATGTMKVNNPSVDVTNCAFVYKGYNTAYSCTSISAVASGAGSISYKWSTNATTSSITVCPTSNTTYSVTTTDGNGCKATDAVTVQVVDVSCEKNKVKVSHSGLTLCIDKTSVADHLAHGDKLGAWGTILPCSSNSNLNNNHTNKDALLNTAHSSDEMLIYPNPVFNILNLQLNVNTEGAAQIDIMDITGKQVLMKKQTMLEGENLMTIDVSNLSSGMYMIRYTDTQQKVQTMRVVKL